MALGTLNSHKLRSFLTILGVLIGVTAVLTNVAMVKGFNAFFQEEIKGLGANFVSIQAGTSQFQENVEFEEYFFDTLKNLPHVEKATAGRGDYGTVEYMGEKNDLFISGVKTGYFKARSLKILEGSALTQQDKHSVVVSRPLAEEDFKNPIIVNSTIKIILRKDSGETVTEEFKVTGICEKLGEYSPIQIDAYIPISTFNDMLGEEGYTNIGLFAVNQDHVDTVKRETVKTLDRLLKIEPETTFPEKVSKGEKERRSPTAVGAEAEEAITEKREKYRITTQSSVLDFISSITSTLNLVFLGIASISLLVGGIGIANIMLVTVSERTREIGVMKAVGAKNRDVLILFLLESGLMGLLGGVIGLGLGYFFSQTLVPAIMGIKGIIPLSWIGISLGISFTVGVVSGLYPAWRAAKMDPVEALSYE